MDTINHGAIRCNPTLRFTLPVLKYAHTYILLARSSGSNLNFSPYRSTSNHCFGYRAIVRQGPPNYCKTTLNTAIPNAAFIWCSSAVPGSQINFVLLYDQLFSSYVLIWTSSTQNNPQNDLERHKIKEIHNTLY